MTALTIKLKRIVIPLNAKLERMVIVGLFVLVLFLIITYLYFITQTIITTVERENMNNEISDLGSHVSSLEVQYIELKNKIDLDFAYKLGYRDVVQVNFVSRKELGKTLTLRGN